MQRWSPIAYLAVTLASTALAAVQPVRVPEADAVAWFDDGGTTPVAAYTASPAETGESVALLGELVVADTVGDVCTVGAGAAAGALGAQRPGASTHTASALH